VAAVAIHDINYEKRHLTVPLFKNRWKTCTHKCSLRTK